jgi:hypothetical protein
LQRYELLLKCGFSSVKNRNVTATQRVQLRVHDGLNNLQHEQFLLFVNVPYYFFNALGVFRNSGCQIVNRARISPKSPQG